jgi:hypothetical protein
VYADAIFEESKELKRWLSVKGRVNRQEYPWTDELEEEVTDFYFNLYRKDWNVPAVKAALSGVPSMNIMDDHGLFILNNH